MNIINPYRFATPAGGGYVVDDYSPDGAWSVCEIASAYVDVDIMTVRRSSDNTTQSFTATEIADGTLTTFTGASNGFVTNLVDQTGGGNDLVQVASSQQPQIVSSGTLLTDGTNPWMEFSGTSDQEMATSASNSWLTGDHSVFWVGQNDNATRTHYLWANADLTSQERRSLANYNNNNLIGVFNGSNTGTSLSDSTDGWVTNELKLVTCIATDMVTGGSHTVDTWVDGAGNSQWTGTGLSTPQNSKFIIASPVVGSTTNEWDGKISACLVFGSDQTSNRADIDSSINSHHSIY